MPEVQMSPAPAGAKQDGRFKKGRSGNPQGRAKGSRNVVTLACEALLEGQAEALTQKAVEMALAGDTVALRLCLERIYPPRRERAATFALRPIDSARDVAEAQSDLVEAVSSGNISPAEAAEISKLLANAAKAYEIADAANGGDVRQYTTDELYRIIAREQAVEIIAPRLPAIGSR